MWIKIPTYHYTFPSQTKEHLINNPNTAPRTPTDRAKPMKRVSGSLNQSNICTQCSLNPIACLTFNTEIKIYRLVKIEESSVTLEGPVN